LWSPPERHFHFLNCHRFSLDPDRHAKLSGFMLLTPIQLACPIGLGNSGGFKSLAA